MSILMVGEPRPPPAAATYGRQTTDSAVASTLTAPPRAAAIIGGGYNKTRQNVRATIHHCKSEATKTKPLPQTRNHVRTTTITL